MRTHRLRTFGSFVFLIVAVCITLGLPVQAQGGNGTIERVSVSSTGAEGFGNSYEPAITPDGRYVAFESDASNLVSGDTNDSDDIFVHDRQTGQTTRVSVTSSGVQGNSDSNSPAISYDGRYVAFQSMAGNFAAADTNGTWDVFVHDRQTGQTTCVSVSPTGEVGTTYTFNPMLSGDGRYVVFWGQASNLVAGDANGKGDVFVRDMQLGQTFLVSVSTAGVQGNQGSSSADISDDGRYVAFNSWATNLVAGDGNNKGDVFIHDRDTGETTLVSVGSGDTSDFPSISGDGRYVAFWVASGFLPEDNNGWADVYVRDRQAGQTTAISLNTSGATGNGSSYQPAITPDGRYVAFESVANDLVAGDSGSGYDVFVRDRQTAQTRRVSVNEAGQPASGIQAAITSDGRYVAFSSDAPNLVPNDTNEIYDVFVQDRDGVAGAPTVTGFSPTSGPVGTSVTINGTNLTGATAVTFNGTNQPTFTVVSATQITAAVPAGATSGPIAVTTAAGTATSAADFTVTLPAPTITGFTPTSGPVGTNVTINGTNFTGATAVTFNSTSQPAFTVVSATQITAAVPAGATTGKIHVTTPGGTANSAANFTVTAPTPTITGFTPTSGTPGTSVTITGTNLTGASAVKFNGVNAASFAVNSATQITAVVSATATTGPIAVTTPGGTATSAGNFTVTAAAPTITGFTPTSGPPGANVTITGTNLTGATSVKFNGVNATSFTVNSATQITAVVPATATTGLIAVTTPGGTATSTNDFTVTAPLPPIYLSTSTNGTLSGKAFTSADILSYVKATNTWDVLYDGSAINTPKNLGAFAFVGNDMILGFSVAQVIPGLGTAKVPAQDLVRFTPTSTGYNTTAGTFALYFDGSDVGLTTSAEAIDALWIDANGRLYISTTGTAKVNGAGGAVITAHDEDVLRFTPASTGANTTGTWALYWDPTAMTGMSAEDINGYWEDPATGARYVTILGAFNVGNTAYGGKFAGNQKTILRFAPNAAAPGGWAPAEKVTWLAAGATFPSNLDGVEMAR